MLVLLIGILHSQSHKPYKITKQGKKQNKTKNCFLTRVVPLLSRNSIYSIDCMWVDGDREKNTSRSYLSNNTICILDIILKPYFKTLFL